MGLPEPSPSQRMDTARSCEEKSRQDHGLSLLTMCLVPPAALGAGHATSPSCTSGHGDRHS